MVIGDSAASNRDCGQITANFEVVGKNELRTILARRRSGRCLFQSDQSPRFPKSGVPPVYLTWADVVFLAFLAFNEINKLRVIRWGQNSDSPRLHHLP